MPEFLIIRHIGSQSFTSPVNQEITDISKVCALRR